MHVSIWLIGAALLAYFVGLFALAGRATPRLGTRAHGDLRPMAYAGSLTTLALGWMLFAAVGDAARQGGAILGLFAGPALAPVVLTPVWRKLRLVARQQKITSLADFLGARYGKSQVVAGAVAVAAALVGITLLITQMETLALVFDVLTTQTSASESTSSGLATNVEPVLCLIVLLACALLCIPGRYLDASGRAPGLIRLILVGSAVTVVTFSILALFALYQFKFGAAVPRDASAHISVSGVVFSQPLLTTHFITVSMLAAGATLCLPRMFQLGVINAGDRRGPAMIRWFLPLFLLWMVLAVMLVATASLTTFDSTVLDPDRFPIALPLSLGHPELALVGFYSALAAGTSGMIAIVAIAGAMLTNEIALPLWERFSPSDHTLHAANGRRLLRCERIIAVGLLIAAWLGYRAVAPPQGLAELGLASLAGTALFMPPLVGALYVETIKYRGVVAGLAAGAVVWLYTLILPAFGLVSGTNQLIPAGEFGINWLQPHALLGVSFNDSLAHGLIWTLFAETIVMLAVSFNTRSSLIERTQASAFIDPRRSQRDRRAARALKTPNIRVAELEVLLRRFLGDQVARETLDEYAGEHDHDLLSRQNADAGMIRFAENRLAGVVGTSAARWLLSAGSSRGDIGLDDVARVLDRTADAVQFNRGVLRAALENSDQGISVIDADLRLVTWNSRYLTLFNYPDGFVRTGRHIADLIRYNASRGECGPGPIEDHVQRRLNHLRCGKSHRFERHRNDGSVLYMTGNPIPGGGFVTTFNDITEFKAKQAELARANARLEARVAERTAALSRSNDQLINENRRRARAEHNAENARQVAERANLSKSRFLAAASHDLLQPLNAARLFAEAAGGNGQQKFPDIHAIEQIRAALNAAQELLEPLLDISKLDAGRWPVNMQTLSLNRVLNPLSEQFTVIARDAGLDLRYVPSTAIILTDPGLLQRVVGNLISNAVRYTGQGRVLVGMRREPEHMRIEVWDTGPGISEQQKYLIFEEFQRGDAAPEAGDRGLGLGLSLADRLCRLMGHELECTSTPGRGTRFSVRVKQSLDAATAENADSSLRPMMIEHVVCVEDDDASRDGMINILEGWSVDALTAAPDDVGQIIADGVVEAALIDYDLGHDTQDGLSLIARCRAVADIRYVLVTANRSPDIAKRAAEHDIRIVYKPVMARALRAALDLDLDQKALTAG